MTRSLSRRRNQHSPQEQGGTHTTHSIHTQYAHTHHRRPYTHTVYTDTDNTRRGCDRPEFKETEADYTKACKDYITQQATLMRS
jgi:hypothetical protein